MKILGIESSCDDTSVALVEATAHCFKILAEKTASQIEIHKKYGGVVPEIAGRMHAEKILPLIEEVLNNQKPDCIAVTSGPGLITGLLVGVEAAKTLSYLCKVPIVSVNHIEGHICSPLIPSPNGEESLFRATTKANSKMNLNNTEKGSLTPSGIRDFVYPALALIASGGHTELILIKKQGIYNKIGATLDDAAGECFDKVAKLLGFDYPGGPKISKFAETGNPQAINFPRPMLNNFSAKGGPASGWDFSFAGLKTSALYWLRDHNLAAVKILPYNLPAGIYGQQPNPITINDFCASFEQAIIDVLVGKTTKAALKHQPKTIIIGGGVAANKKLRDTLTQAITPLNCELRIPDFKYCMDNAAMIAVAGYYQAKNKKFTKWNKLIANPNWEIN